MQTRRTLGAAIAGGLLAGALVGCVEAAVGWMRSSSADAAPALPWALCAYGLLGACGGAVAGCLAALIRTDGFALGLAGVGTALAIVVGRFRIVRDVLMERPPEGALPRLVELAAMAAAVMAGYVLWRRLRGVTARRALATRPFVAAAAVGAVAVTAAVLSPLLVRESSRAATRRPAAAAPGAPPIVLIVVDTLRADHLPAYGYAAGSTPNLDAFARDAIRYTEAFSQASWTRPSFATIFTGLYPSSHGAMHKADRLPDRVDTVAEILRNAGYRTVGFANNANISPAFNFQQGFDEYHYLEPALFFHASDAASQLTLYSALRLLRERFLSGHVDVRNYYRPAEDVTDAAVAWLRAAVSSSTPFLLFVHYMDPHDPYFAHPFDGEGHARVANPNPPPAAAARYRELYDGEIRYLDEHVGRLLHELDRSGLYERSLVLFTADHGEEFHEHGGWWHGTTLYDEQVRVPLLVKLPGRTRGGREASELVMSVDVAPTLIAAAQLPVPSAMQGRALTLASEPGSERTHVFAEEDFEGNVLQAVRTRTAKFVIANPGNPRGLPAEQLFDLGSDPGELHDLARQERAAAESMRAQLGRSFLEARAQAGATQQGDADAATRERLRALGYVD